MLEVLVSLIAIVLYSQFFWLSFWHDSTPQSIVVLQYPLSMLMVSIGTGFALPVISLAEIVTGLLQLSSGSPAVAGLSIVAGIDGLFMTMLSAKTVWYWYTTEFILQDSELHYRLPFGQVGTLDLKDVECLSANRFGWIRLETASGETVWVSDLLSNFRHFAQAVVLFVPREAWDRKSLRFFARLRREMRAP